MRNQTKYITEFVIKLVKGMIVGVGSITAGAGTFAIILGIYDRCMEIIAKPFKNFRKNLIYIFPIVTGIVISFFLLKDVISYLFNNYAAYTKCLFFGIILGGIPTLLKQANKQGKNKKNIIPFLLAFIVTIIATYFGNRFGSSNGIGAKMETFHLVIYGIIYGFGAIMPGMTTLHVLIFLGVWGPILSGILGANFSIIIPFGIGYLAIVLITANLISFFFKHFYGYTYYAIIGFTITSLVMLIPKPLSLMEYIICPIVFLISSVGMYYISKLENRIVKEEIKVG